MLKICCLYPELLKQHGNWGNVAALLRRCAWRQIDAELVRINPGEPVDFEDVDIVYLGTMSEQERNLVLEDLMPRREALKTAIERGLVVLAVGGGCYMLGMHRLTEEGDRVAGLGLVSFYTRLTSTWLVGDCVIGMQLAGEEVRVAGFENHREHIFKSPEVPALGEVLYGYGNNGRDQTEGFRYRNVFGSSLMALLPKNPMLADLLLGAALRNKRARIKFPALEGKLEEQAVEVILKRYLPNG